MWFDYIGSNDIYICVTHEGGCNGSQQPYEDLWYGNPLYPPPQSCNGPGHYCEHEEYGGGTKRNLTKKPVSGHTLYPEDHPHSEFTTIDEVRAWIKANLSMHMTTDGSYDYRSFAYEGTRYALIVPLQSNRFGIKYFGVETGKFSENAPNISGSNPQPNETQGVVRIRYNGQQALIWMR